MIYTITTNPSLDYYLSVDKLNDNALNRSGSEEYDAAGKGVNVSKILDKLNIPSVALGFIGGFNKNYYLDLLSLYKNIQPQFTTIKENTRINVKVVGNNDLSLNAKGPSISSDEYDLFSKRLESVYDNDFVVLSGNVQTELNKRIKDDVVKLINDGVKVILDTDIDISESLLEYKPFLVKTNDTHIGVKQEDILKLGKEFINKGAKYFLYSSPFAAFYLMEEGHYYKCDIVSDHHLPLTGTGDAMIAGFVWACLRGANGLEAFTYATSVVLTNELLQGKEMPYSKIDEIYNSLKVECFEY